MNIIDAHHHLWDIDLHDYPWLIKDRKNPLSKNYLTEDFNKEIPDVISRLNNSFLFIIHSSL